MLRRPGPPEFLKPVYTDDARQAEIDGSVLLSVRIGADGTVERARVVRPLDKEYGLDEQAMFAVGKWLFEPATLDGDPVPMDEVMIEMSFSLERAGE